MADGCPASAVDRGTLPAAARIRLEARWNERLDRTSSLPGGPAAILVATDGLAGTEGSGPMGMVAGWRVLRAGVLGCARVVGEGLVWLGLVHANAAASAMPIIARHAEANAGTDIGAGASEANQEPTLGAAGASAGSALPAAGHPERISAPEPGTAAEIWLYEQLRALDAGPDGRRAR